MNYLAHAYLSFNQPEILVGNMISDFVKGKKKLDYPLKIQVGIQLHRYIDEYTDQHPSTKNIKEFFRADYRLYAGAFADVVYDYFLALDKNIFPSPNDLLVFSEETYTKLEKNSNWFPLHFSSMFPYMKKQNWLYNYQFEHGIKNSFEGVRRRSLYIEETEKAFLTFLQHKDEMKIQYKPFIEDVKHFAAQQLSTLLNE